MGEFYEKFQRGAFTEWLAAGNDVRGLYEHDHSMLLGRTRSGTLKLEEDETGLRFELTHRIPVQGATLSNWLNEVIYPA